MAKRKVNKSKAKAASKLPANHKTKGRHGKATVRWGTPEDVLERERAVFRALARNEYEREHPIDLDPFTEDRFNEIVGASVAYSLRERKEDGLALPWSIPNAIGVRLPWTLRDDKAPALAAVSTRAHVNHPGGLTEESWRKLVAEYAAGRVRAAFWIGFSVEQLGILADEHPHPMDFSCVILRKRIPFVHHNRKVKKRQPSHANYIVAIGVPITLFEEQFGALGKVVHGVEAVLETLDNLRNRAPNIAAQLFADRHPELAPDMPAAIAPADVEGMRTVALQPLEQGPDEDPRIVGYERTAGTIANEGEPLPHVEVPRPAPTPEQEIADALELAAVVGDAPQHTEPAP